MSSPDGNEMLIFYEKLNNDDSGEEEFEPGDVVDISCMVFLSLF